MAPIFNKYECVVGHELTSHILMLGGLSASRWTLLHMHIVHMNDVIAAILKV